MAVGIKSVLLNRQIHPGKPRAWLFLVPPRRARTIDNHVRVVENPGIPRPNLHRLHPLRCRDWHRNDKVPKHFGSVGAELIRLRDVEHQVGLSELPFRIEFRRRGCLRGGSRERSLLRPLPDQLDLRITQPALLREIAITFFRLPGRHDSPFRHINDLRGVPFDVVVC